MQARPRMGWLAGPAKLGCGQVSFSLFFSILLSFLFTLFSILNFKSDFKSVLQDLGIGTFYKIPFSQ
jgi:hypothetical protein